MPLSFFTNSGNSYGSAIPFQRIVEPAQLGMFLNLEQAELLRIQRYNEHWRFYFGKQWIFDREDGEPLVTVNYAKLIVDKGVSWLVKNGFELNLPEATKHVVGPFLEEVWDYNNREIFTYETAMTGGVTGDSFVMVTYQEPTELARRANPNSQGQIRVDLLGSEQVYPSWDPLNTDVTTAVRIETIYYDDRNQLTKVDRDDKANHQGRTLNVKRFTQIITPDFIIESYEGGQPEVRENILGEVMVVHIKNLPLPNEYYGLSDLDGVIDLQREYNEKSTDQSDTINYHASPVTVIQGAKASQLERGARQIWSGLPVDAKVYNLQLEGDMTATQNYRADIKKSMLEIAEIPEILLEAPPISNTSGVALTLQYGPIIDKTKRKLPLYNKGFREINRLILRIGQVLGLIHLPYDLCKECGGRIVEILDTSGLVPRTRKKCFQIDSQTFDFLTPEQVKIKYIRQHSMGQEITERPFGQIKEEHGKVSASYWDPEKETTQQEKQDRKQRESDAETNAQRSAEPSGPDQPKPKALKSPSKTAEPPQMSGDIYLPPEPMEVLLSVILVDPVTGERAGVDRKTVMLVPAECTSPQYLDPFDVKVTFKDALPRDHVIEYQHHRDLMLDKIVSRKWVRRKTRSIDPSEYDRIERELEEEASEKPGVASEEEDSEESGSNNPRNEQARAALPGGHNSPSPRKDKEV